MGYSRSQRATEKHMAVKGIRPRRIAPSEGRMQKVYRQEQSLGVNPSAGKAQKATPGSDVRELRNECPYEAEELPSSAAEPIVAPAGASASAKVSVSVATA